jgi:hypothetical protein
MQISSLVHVPAAFLPVRPERDDDTRKMIAAPVATRSPDMSMEAVAAAGLGASSAFVAQVIGQQAAPSSPVQTVSVAYGQGFALGHGGAFTVEASGTPGSVILYVADDVSVAVLRGVSFDPAMHAEGLVFEPGGTYQVAATDTVLVLAPGAEAPYAVGNFSAGTSSASFSAVALSPGPSASAEASTSSSSASSA